jgi:hypothetical protein
MSHRRYDAMRHAVGLARTGRFTDWSSVAARLRAEKYRKADVDWTPVQQRWLDRLCIEARCARLAARSEQLHRSHGVH